MNLKVKRSFDQSHNEKNWCIMTKVLLSVFINNKYDGCSSNFVRS